MFWGSESTEGVAEMAYEIETRVLAKQDTAVVEAVLHGPELPHWLAAVYHDIATYLERIGVEMAGPPFVRYAFRDATIDVQAGFPVVTPVAGEGRIVPSSLPAGPVAITTHYGPYDRLVAAYDAIATWLKEHGYEPAGPHWEIYYTDPNAEPNPTKWRTDLVMPYRAA